MYQQPYTQPSVAVQPKPLICYNCGSGDHFMIACPEQARPIPAGLAAARAAQAAEAAQSTGVAGDSHSVYGNRPFKRQKTGPVVTRFPAPPTGPVVTHYASQPTQASPYPSNLGHNYYNGTLAQPYQQQTMLQSQSYVQSLPIQQSTHYLQHGHHSIPNIPQGYVQPTAAAGSQCYSHLVPNVPEVTQSYRYSNAQSMSQYGYQNAYGASYQDGFQTAQISQPYGHDSLSYGHPPITGQPSQNYPPVHPQPSFHGQQGQLYTPYQGPSPMQSYGPPTPAQDQNAMQSWVQAPAVHQSSPAPAYQPGGGQFQQSYQNQHRKRPYKHGNQNQLPLGMQGNSTDVPNPYFGPPTPQKGSGVFANPQQYRKYPGPTRSYSAIDSTFASTSPSPNNHSSDNKAEEAEFDWAMEAIFVTETKKKPDSIGHPLPTVYDEQPILPPAYNSNGIISKYVRPNNLEIFERDIRLSLHWPSVKADPAFNEIAFDSPPIPLDDITAWIQQRQTRLDLRDSIQNSVYLSPPCKRAWSGEHEDDTRNIRQNLLLEPAIARNSQFLRGSIDGESESLRPVRGVTPILERSTTPACARSVTPSFGHDDDAWAPQPGEGQISTSPVADSTEALLASLGVSGSPKPITSNNLTLHVSPIYMDDITQDFYNRAPARHDSGYASQRGSVSHENKNIAESTTTYSEYRQTYSASKPPPPPPPPLHMRKQVDGPLDSPSSDGSVNFRVGGYAPPNEAQNNGLHQGGSPLTPNSAEGFAHENTMLSEPKVSKRTGPLRQVDDVTPKLKRRQPQVADAYSYSRRW